MQQKRPKLRQKIFFIMGLLYFLMPAISFAYNIKVVGLFKNMAVINVDSYQYTLHVGEATPEGIVLLTSNAHRASLKIDGQAKTFTLGTDVSTNLQSPDQVIVHIAPDQTGMYRINGYVNGSSVNFLVDTGASRVALNEKLAQLIGISRPKPGHMSTIMVSTAMGEVQAYPVSLSSVRIGELELKNISALVIAGDNPKEVLLGQSFINRVTLRHDGSIMQLVKKW